MDEASRNDLAISDVVTVTSLDAASSYLWALAYIPAGSTAAFSGSATASSPGTFTVDLPGAYLVRLLINGGRSTGSEQYVLLRAETQTGLLLAAAGEGPHGNILIPVDYTDENYTDVQSANLQTLETRILDAEAAIGPAPTTADQFLYSSGASTWALGSITTAGRAMVGLSWSAGTQVPSVTAAGTAGLLTVGAAANNLVQLDSSAKLPAVDGSLLTNLPSAGGGLVAANNLSDLVSVPTARTNLGLGSAATLTAGTGASNVVQLDGSSQLPAVNASQLIGLTNSQVGSILYPADSWTYQWTTATGDPLTNGWSNAGVQNITTASTTHGSPGVACYSLTPPSASGTAIIKYNTTAATGNWELRMKIYLPVSASTNQNFGFAYSPDTTQSASKRYQYMFTSSTSATIAYWNGSAMATAVTVPDLTGRWVDITIRTYVTGTGLSNTWQEIWVGKNLMWQGMSPTSLGAASTAAGDILLGRLTTGTNTSVIYIAEVSFKNGINIAPPSYTFLNSTWPL